MASSRHSAASRNAAPEAAGSAPEAPALASTWAKAREQALAGAEARLDPREVAKTWALRFTPEEIVTLIVPKRTLARRLAKQELLTVEETDRALRLARVSAEADRVFGDPDKASRWLRKPNPALAGRAPIDLLKSETGAQAVDEVLIAIDHGMFV